MQSVKKHKKLSLVFLMLVLVLIFDLSPFGGSIRYYAKWAACGTKPVSLHAQPGLMWYTQTSSIEITRFGYQEYRCTPLEAEQAGYSASSTAWSFPHIQQ